MTDVHHEVIDVNRADENTTSLTDEPKRAQGQRTPRSAIIVSLFLAAAVVTVGSFALSVVLTLPSNVLFTRDGNHPVRTAFNTLDPQDWAFFTRDPQGTQIGAYTVEAGGDVYSLMTTPQGAVTNLYGLSRNQRAQGPELGFLNATVHDWATCEDPSADCIAEASRSAPADVSSTSPVPTICGDIVLTEEHTTPWSFRNLSDEYRKVTATAPT